MNRFSGKVGFVTPQKSETNRGIVKEIAIERTYYGDIVDTKARWSGSQDGVNDNVALSCKISIIADPFAYQHIPNIKYVEYMGALWKVTDITIQSPRLILSVGGVWNGARA